uniref:Putative mitochondrial glycerol-3-phosphate acyltransferase gpat n=1 Tax=Hyalomma excavatum TaxID=257692 RepID=A0A131XDD6_9ACAR
MLTALVLFVSVYLAVRALMVKVLQNLQGASTMWNFKSPPRVKESPTSPAHRVHSQFYHRFLDGDRVYWRNPALTLDEDDVDSTYVPCSKQTEIPEVLPNFKRWQPMEQVLLPEELHYVSLESCEKCLPMSKFHLGAGANATLQGLDNALMVPTICRSWLSPVEFLKNSIYLTCKSIPHNYAPIPKEILSSERVEDAINRAIEDDPGTDRAEHRKRAASIFERMRASISTSLLRVAVWFMHRIMSRMLTGVYVPKGQIDMIKRASEQNVPMVYLPLHRSHLDYILVTYLLYLHGMRVPLVAAGDNLLIPIFGQLLRGLGGFFIKRRLDFKDGRKDHVYRAVLKEYMKEILKAKHSLEFFLEGGRSRTGKTRLPKAGLLSVIVDSLNEEPEDVFIVPISISYEKLLDGNFVSEQLGEPKVMETFTAALASIWRILHSNYGAVRVDFCQPFSLREFLNSARLSCSAPLYCDCPLSLLGPAKDCESPVKYTKDCTSANSPASADSLPEDTRAAIKSLANHVVYQSTASLALMSTNLVAFLLLTKHRKGGTLQQLAESLRWLRSAVSQRNHQVMCPGESAETVRHACALLGKELVISETVQMEWSSGDTENNNVKIVFYRPALHLPSVLELQYYANAVLPVFVHEAIVVTALYAITGDHIAFMYGRESPLISRCDLLSKCQDLINLLQREFVLVLPCSSVQAVISDAIMNLVRENVLNICQCPNQKRIPGSTKYWPDAVLQASALEDESGETPSSNVIEEQYRIVLDYRNLIMLEFLRSVLASYIESYYVVACSLSKLVGTQMEERIFFRQIQKVAQNKLQEGTLCYEESFAADTLHNAVQLYEQWGIVEHHTQDGMRVLYLKEQWNVDEAVDSVIAFVAAFVHVPS